MDAVPSACRSVRIYETEFFIVASAGVKDKGLLGAELWISKEQEWTEDEKDRIERSHLAIMS